MVVQKNVLVKIRQERDLEINNLEKKITKLEDSIVIVVNKRDSLLIEKNLLQNQVNISNKKISYYTNKITNLTNSTKALTDTELFNLANKEYGNSDTLNARKVIMFRPTVEYLVETSQKYKECTKQFNEAVHIIGLQKEQLLIDSVVFNTYDTQLSLKDSIIVNKDEQLKVSLNAYDKLETKAKRNGKLKDLLIVILLTTTGYGIIK